MHICSGVPFIYSWRQEDLRRLTIEFMLYFRAVDTINCFICVLFAFYIKLLAVCNGSTPWSPDSDHSKYHQHLNPHISLHHLLPSTSFLTYFRPLQLISCNLYPVTHKHVAGSSHFNQPCSSIENIPLELQGQQLTVAYNESPEGTSNF